MKFLPSVLALICAVSLHADETRSAASQLQPFVDKHELAGAVALVTAKDKTTVVETVGFADIAARAPMKQDAMFWIASQTKPITAVAVMMLADDGKLSLDDPVEKHLPEFRGQLMVAEKNDTQTVLRKPSRPVTIRDTLCHMSGMPFKSAIEEPTLDGLPLAAAVRSYAMTPLQWEPGTRYQYSNTGINTAGRIIEVVSKTSYEDFMQQRLFGPLGMKDTSFWLSEEQAKRMAKCYRPDASKKNLEEFQIGYLLYPFTDRHRRFPMPGGGLFSTADDTARFCRMMLNRGELDGKRYLSEASWKELTKRQTPESVKESYGLGFIVGKDSFGHGGAQGTNMEIYPDKGLALIWMVQHGGFPGEGGKAQGVFKNNALSRFAK